MKSPRFPKRLLLFFLIVSSSLVLAAEEKNKSRDFPLQNIFEIKTAKVETIADHLEYSREDKKIIARDNVLIRYQDMQITSDYAEVDAPAKKAYARGHVVVFREGEARAQGEEIYYDFGNDSGSFPDGRVITYPWFTTGKDIQQVRKGVKVIQDAKVTTCSLEKPHYDVRAKKVTIYEADKMIARWVTIRVLGKPILWWPYVILPLKQPNLPLGLVVGYNSRYGYYVQFEKGIAITKQIGGALHIDWRSKRGFGSGVDLDYDYGPKAAGKIKTYLTQDHKAPTPSAANPYSQTESRPRGRVTWIHRSDFDESTNLILRYNRFADENFLQDFFESEFKAETEPQSFATLTKNTDRFGIMTHVEKKMNSFEATVERLPEVELNWKNQPFFGGLLKDRVYYENHLRFDNMNKSFKRSDFDENAVRADDFNEWSSPVKWKEIKLTPFVNYEGTYYSRQNRLDEDTFRSAFGWGADLRTQLYKTIPTHFSKFGLEINHLRHLIEPSIQYHSVVSTVSDEKLQRFDAIDSIDDEHAVTFGIENRLQTKRVVGGQMQRVDLVSLNTYLSYELNPDGVLRSTTFAPIPNGQTSSGFTTLTQELVLRPYEWVQYELRGDYDMWKDQLHVLNQDLTAQGWHSRFLIGHRFLRNIGDIREESNQFVFEASWIINPRWEMGGYLRWDPEVRGVQEWQVAARRDMHDFLLDFGYNVRDSLIRSRNQEIFFNFRMKAFPSASVHHGGQRASFSQPRIGETVAGANKSTVPAYHPFGKI